MTDGLYRVVLPHAVYGIEITDGLVSRSAPIGQWAKWLPIEHVEKWVHSKGGTVERIGD